jgi:hypothetical protein
VGVTLAKNEFVMSQAFFGMKQFPLDVWHVKTTNILDVWVTHIVSCTK